VLKENQVNTDKIQQTVALDTILGKINEKEDTSKKLYFATKTKL
jgi:hypothetical protein